VLMRAVLRDRHAALGGEMSGHILFAEAWHGADDALYAAVRVLAALTRLQTSLAQFRRGLPSMAATPELRLPCPPQRKGAVVHEVAARLQRAGAEVDLTDGVRVTTNDGWWLLRASGTEAKLTVRCEGRDDACLERLKSALAAQLAASGLAAAIEDEIPASAVPLALQQ
jgi:phosphomannomutase